MNDIERAKAMLSGEAREYDGSDIRAPAQWYRPMTLDEALQLRPGSTVYYLWENLIYKSVFVEHADAAMKCYHNMVSNTFHCPHTTVHKHMMVPL